MQTRYLQWTGPTQTGAPDSQPATRRKPGPRLRPPVGGGRSRPAQSCETLGASGHVSARFPFSKLQPAPGPPRGLATERDPRRVRNAPPSPPNIRARQPRASSARGLGYGPQEKSRFLQACASDAVSEAHTSVRGPPLPNSTLRLQSPFPDGTPQPRGPIPVRNALNFGSRPQTPATRSQAQWAAFARLEVCGYDLGPVLPESEPHARGPTPDGPSRQHTPLAALTSGFSSPRSYSHPEPRRPSEHLEEGGTPGTWQL